MSLQKLLFCQKSQNTKFLSGGGFKAHNYTFYSSKIKNLTTKRLADAKLLTVDLDSPMTYLPAFNTLTLK